MNKKVERNYLEITSLKDLRDSFIISDDYKPISSILFAFQSRFANDYGAVSAASILMAAPIAILFMFFQRRFISGLTSGATKG